jgi:hypothetical protein
MRSVPSHCAMLSLRMPAATLRCSAPRWAALGGRVPEGLGLDGPDHQAAARFSAAPASAARSMPNCASRRTGLFPGLDHLDLAGGHALADQPADDGAGHVAAADEGDGAVVCAHGVSRYSKATNCVTCSGLKLSSLTHTRVRWPLGSTRAPGHAFGVVQPAQAQLRANRPPASWASAGCLPGSSCGWSSVLLPSRVSTWYRRSELPTPVM